MSWLNPTEDERKLADEFKEFSKNNSLEFDRYRWLQVLAIALRIEPLLLRNARLHFAPAGDIEWESELWFSSLIWSRSAKSALMREGSARMLVDDLRAEPTEFKRAWDFVQEHTKHWPEADRLEQELRLAAASEDQMALKQGFDRILKTLQQTTDDHERRDWARWAKGALAGLATEQDEFNELNWLRQYIAAALGSSGQVFRKAEPIGAMPAWLRSVLPKSERQNLYLRLHPGVLECLKEKDSLPFHQIQIPLPLPTPFLLTENDEKSRWEGFWPGRRIRVATNLRTLTLQTLTGERFRFEVKDEGGGSGEKPSSKDTIVLAYQSPDRALAKRIEGILAEYRMQIKLIEDDPEAPAQASGESAETIRLMRLWTPNAADYWQKHSGQRVGFGGQGLLLRIDPSVPLPEGASDTQVFDLSDMEKGLDPEVAARLFETVQRFLKTPESEPPDDEDVPEGYTAEQWTEIQRLLKEIDNPETEPPRRLEIGDRLAVLGDPRPGVGVREVRMVATSFVGADYIGAMYSGGRLPVDVNRGARMSKKRGISKETNETHFPPQIQALLDEINDINTEPPRRLEIGDELARLGDPRKGVGLDENGLPDIDWVEVPGGPFIYRDGETINLPTFYIARYPVTNLQFHAFVYRGGYKEGKWTAADPVNLPLSFPSYWHDLNKPEPAKSRWDVRNRPRTNVDWYEAMAFCRWLSASLGYQIRLPTEQEWEKAARGQKGLVYPWGDEYRSGIANINETWGTEGRWNLGQTTAVGMYPRDTSPYGVADLAGNVWEWCLNKYDKPEVTTPDRSGEARALRGGSWDDYADGARSGGRHRSYPVYRSYYRGFRVLSSLPIR